MIFILRCNDFLKTDKILLINVRGETEKNDQVFALLLENIIGLQPVAPDDKLYWDLRLRERHGVENYRFGDNVIDILCQSNDLPRGSALIKIQSNSSFELMISSQIGKKTFQINEGSQNIVLEF